MKEQQYIGYIAQGRCFVSGGKQFIPLSPLDQATKAGLKIRQKYDLKKNGIWVADRGKYWKPEPATNPQKVTLVKRRMFVIPFDTDKDFFTEKQGLYYRMYEAWGYSSEHATSNCVVECPYCLSEHTVYVWSLAGGGKKCDVCNSMLYSGNVCFASDLILLDQ